MQETPPLISSTSIFFEEAITKNNCIIEMIFDHTFANKLMMGKLEHNILFNYYYKQHLLIILINSTLTAIASKLQKNNYNLLIKNLIDTISTQTIQIRERLFINYIIKSEGTLHKNPLHMPKSLSGAWEEQSKYFLHTANHSIAELLASILPIYKLCHDFRSYIKLNPNMLDHYPVTLRKILIIFCNKNARDLRNLIVICENLALIVTNKEKMLMHEAFRKSLIYRWITLNEAMEEYY